MSQESKQDFSLERDPDIQAEDPAEWIGRSAVVDLGPVVEGVQLWGEETNKAFRSTLLGWYDREKRDLPWRRDRDPYHIWVSEIMLQQTQVDTVIPYYARFLDTFPDVEALARSSEDQLLQVWQGLGYYSRVRNMKAAAQQIMSDWDGKFPDNYKDIKKLKGIGPYTAGAIASIAFGQAVPAIDGNAMRVFGRIFTIKADISREKNRRLYQEVVQYIIDPDRPGDFNQAVMDLGSSYERAKAPLSDLSPIRDYNLASLTGTALDYPVKVKRTKHRDLAYDALIIENRQGQVLIQKRSQERLLGNMWTVPLLEGKLAVETASKKKAGAESGSSSGAGLGPADGPAAWEAVVAEAEKTYQISPILMKEPLGRIKHVFSHQTWHINVYYARLHPEEEQELIQEVEKRQDLAWVYLHDLSAYAFPTVQMKIWQLYLDKGPN